MSYIIVAVLSMVFLFLAGIHFYWGFGGTWGGDAVIPTNPAGDKMLHPGMRSCLVVFFAFIFATWLLWQYIGWLPFWIPAQWVQYGVVAMAVVFLLRATGDFKYVGFFKKIRSTKFARMDTKLFSPLCFLIAVLLLLVLVLER
jgi:Protein of unknown function (DUF3995)